MNKENLQTLKRYIKSKYLEVRDLMDVPWGYDPEPEFAEIFSPIGELTELVEAEGVTDDIYFRVSRIDNYSLEEEYDPFYEHISGDLVMLGIHLEMAGAPVLARWMYEEALLHVEDLYDRRECLAEGPDFNPVAFLYASDAAILLDKPDIARELNERYDNENYQYNEKLNGLR